MMLRLLVKLFGKKDLGQISGLHGGNVLMLVLACCGLGLILIYSGRPINIILGPWPGPIKQFFFLPKKSSFF